MSGTLGLRPPYGISNFTLLREAGYFHVDKTNFIRMLEERPERYLLYLSKAPTSYSSSTSAEYQPIEWTKRRRGCAAVERDLDEGKWSIHPEF